MDQSYFLRVVVYHFLREVLSEGNLQMADYVEKLVSDDSHFRVDAPILASGFLQRLEARIRSYLEGGVVAVLP